MRVEPSQMRLVPFYEEMQRPLSLSAMWGHVEKVAANQAETLTKNDIFRHLDHGLPASCEK